MMHSSNTMRGMGRGDEAEQNRPASTAGMNILNPDMISNNVVDFSVGSMPTNYGYDESFGKEDDPNEMQYKPRILIMGLRRSAD